MHSARSVRVKADVIRRLANQRKLSPDDMRRELGMDSIEGYNLILRKGTTKPATLSRIAEILGVHPSQIAFDRLRYQAATMSDPGDIVDLNKMRDMIEKHELEIQDLTRKYTNLLENLLKNHRPPQA